MRPHIPYLVYVSMAKVEEYSSWAQPQGECEQMRICTQATSGIAMGSKGWAITKVSRGGKGRAMLHAGMIVAHAALHLDTCSTTRMWRGVVSMPPLTGFTASEVILWVAHQMSVIRLRLL